MGVAAFAANRGPTQWGCERSRIAAGRRRHGVPALFDLTEAARASRIMEKHRGH
jgi:hypothetical protein